MFKLIRSLYIEIHEALTYFVWKYILWDYTGSLHNYDAHLFKLKIESHPHNAAEYRKAIERLLNGETWVSFTLHDGEVITLY
jgi:hypothetical protein